MSDSPAPTPLTDQAMKRLRALAAGNGIEPDSITLLHGDEQVYKLGGVMILMPICDVVNKQYTGPPKGKDAQLLANTQALQMEIARRKQAFQGRTDWIAEVEKELHATPGQGWGLDKAKVVLPSRAVTLAANTACAQCHGNKLITCAQCQGRAFEPCFQCRGQRQETCTTCFGTGLDPQNRNQPCVICRGTRYIPCRLCHATGQIPCRTCGGRGGTPCPTCHGAGQVTEEAQLSFGASASFSLKPGTLPSGLRRGLDRLGIVNLPKGHADVEVVKPKEEDPELHPEDDMGHPPDGKPPEPMLNYIAHLPFADLRIDFGGKKAAVGIFGKRGVPLDVPPFLDGALNPWREKLKAAAQGRGPIEDALKARAVRDALTLELQGKSNVKELRRIYPVGMSAGVADEIVRNMKNAVKHVTLHIRSSVAVLGGVLSAAIFAGCYFTSLPSLLAGTPKWFGLALDFVPPVVAAGCGWLLLNAAIRFMLQRRFPGMPVALKQTTGKTGYAMIAGIFAVWLVMLVLSPAKPVWLPFFH